VQEEKKVIAEQIAKLDDLQTQYGVKIQELRKKYEMTLKEKTMEKLEKDKLAARVSTVQAQIQAHEDEVRSNIEANE
jgi:regulator of replication initiation timing